MNIQLMRALLSFLCLVQLSLELEHNECHQQVAKAVGTLATLCCRFPVSVFESETAAKSIVKYDASAPSQDLSLNTNLIDEASAGGRYSVAYLKIEKVVAWLLTIRNITAADHGSYRCIALPPAHVTPLYTTAVLVVYAPRSIVVSNEFKTVQLGKSLSLTCHGIGGPITWFKYDFMGVRKDLQITEPVYSLDSVREEDAGRYDCYTKITNTFVQYKQFTVDVKFPLSVSFPFKRLVQAPGKTVMLQCVVSGNPPAYQAHWLKGSSRLTGGSKYRLHYTQIGQYRTVVTLQFRLAPEDFDQLECWAYKLGQADRASTRIINPAGDTVVVTPKTIVAAAGRAPVAITCTPSSISDGLTWWWVSQTNENERKRIYRSKVTREPLKDLVDTNKAKYEVTKDYTLLLKIVEPGDEGIYVCGLSTAINDSAALAVVEKPTCENKSPLFTSGSALRLMCSFKYHGDIPQFAATWEHTRNIFSSVNQDSEGLISRALVLKTADAGSYRCQIAATSPQYDNECTVIVGLPGGSRAVGQVGVGGAGRNSTGTCSSTGKTVASVFVALLSVTALVLLAVIAFMQRNCQVKQDFAAQS